MKVGRNLILDGVQEADKLLMSMALHAPADYAAFEHVAGDGRLAERLRSDEFLPLASRVRVRLPIERAPPQDLQDCLRHAQALFFETCAVPDASQTKAAIRRRPGAWL